MEFEETDHIRCDNDEEETLVVGKGKVFGLVGRKDSLRIRSGHGS